MRDEEERAPDQRRGRRLRLLRRFTRGQRAVAAVAVAAFLVSLVYSFYYVPRLRYAFTRVPVIHRTGAAGARAGVSAVRLDSLVELVVDGVRRGAFPGGALAIGQRAQTLLEVGIGRTTWSRLGEPVDPEETLYDLASLTKVLGTTTAVMALVEDGRLHLDDRVVEWLPEFTGGGRDSVTVRQLLTHTSGLPAGHDLHGSTPRERLQYLISHVDLIARPGEQVLYSDIGFIILAEVAKRAAGEDLPDFLRRRVWGPLGMDSTRYEPGAGCDECAPTLTVDSAGITNDPTARELGRVVGNASLFSTGHDVGRFVAMLANGGILDGVRIFRPETIREFTRPQPGAGTRGLGFEVFCREGTVPDALGCLHPFAYGHTGYTGTSFWVGPLRGIWVVLLTNRTFHPRAPNHLLLLRRLLFLVATADAYRPPELWNDTLLVNAE
ncbi:MAG TPA: serine hydrolase domain-containing protein [Longimicrobiaceae bacterium]|nr:serine hydrolase domain-containing protein [Longimicrobiaceae bacterium]